MTHDDVLKLLRDRFGAETITASQFRDNPRVTVPADRVLAVLEALKQAGFDYLADLSAADYLQYPDARDRFGVWYVLASTATGMRLVVKTWVNDPDPSLPSVVNGLSQLELLAHAREPLEAADLTTVPRLAVAAYRRACRLVHDAAGCPDEAVDAVIGALQALREVLAASARRTDFPDSIPPASPSLRRARSPSGSGP